ncbi:MAG: hypothetical protein IPL89_11010 [Acidobacteria bacterium]|nr:hypothetical protein [Acidobacteriota bacterium]
MLQDLYRLILAKTDFLYTVLVQTPFCFFDIWSIVHFFLGGMLLLVLAARRISRPFFVLFLLLFFYELVEIEFTYLAINVFRPEILLDQNTDILVGLLGGLVALRLKARFEKWGRSAALRTGPVVRDLAVAVTVSAVWVTFYGYRYNVEFFNSRGINWWAFLWWSAGLFAVLRFFGLLQNAVLPWWLATAATWAAYAAVLVAVEYVGYALLGIRELHGERPFAFGVIHGTPALKIYYAVAPPLAIAIATGVQRLAGIATPAMRRGAAAATASNP